MQTCPLQTIPLIRWNPFSFLKALLYEEYYADMSPAYDTSSIHSLFLKSS